MKAADGGAGSDREHLLDGVAISELCDAQGFHPTLYYRWQKEFFEGGAAAFASYIVT